jgi:glyoxylase-like metal-dependent hydrolase (beta-lactamase superfamily II)
VTAEHYEVLIARYGHRDTLRSDVFLNYQLYAQPDGPIGMDYFVWVVRNTERTLVVDTGFSRQGGDLRSRKTEMDVEDLYREVDVDPSTRPTVLITHAHYDHIGNLSLFPDSRLVICRNELEFWNSPSSRHPLFHHSVEDSELAALRQADADGRVDAFTGSTTVAPGVEMIEVGGHTPGQSVVKVPTSEGTVLLASDSVHYYEELEAEMPFTSVSDVVGMYRAFDLIHDWVATGQVQHVISGHDPGTLDRFNPAAGPLRGRVATVGMSSGRRTP